MPNTSGIAAKQRFGLCPNSRVNGRCGPGRSGELGVGLIELMVAIVIALFVLAGLSGVFINMKLSNTGQDSLNQSQDSERVALNLLRTVVQQGGYYQAFSAGSFATAASAFAGGHV